MRGLEFTSNNKKKVRKNVTVAVKGNVLTITIDLSKQVGPSKSGKTTIIATTTGNVAVPGTDAVLGLNLYK